ncbi:MAG: OmpA family protein [Polyangiales bacterium]
MAINLERNWRPVFATIAAVGSLGLLHCNLAKEDTALERRAAEPQTQMNESAPAAPSAVGGGPTATPAMPDTSKAEPGIARGISAVEQYLDGKGTGENRFALEGLSYEQGCPYLTQQGVDSVDTLADLLKKHPQAKVSIESYGDNTGSDQGSKQLSKHRAEVIKKQLVLCGISPSRIETAGRGKESPIASNDSDDGKAKNRRTEIVLHQ